MREIWTMKVTRYPPNSTLRGDINSKYKKLPEDKPILKVTNRGFVLQVKRVLSIRLWKLVSFRCECKMIFVWKDKHARTHFEKGAKGNSEMAYCVHCWIWVNISTFSACGYLKKFMNSRERHSHNTSYGPQSSFESLLLLPLQNNNHRQSKFNKTRCPWRCHFHKYVKSCVN